MNFFYQVKESVIDFKFYKTIKDNTFAKSFLYLLLLLLIVYSLLTARNFFLVKNLMDNTALQISANMPDFQLKDGKFSFQGEMPYYISNNDTEVIVIDTTGTVDEKLLSNVISGMVITEDALHMKSGFRQQSISFAEFRDSEINKQTIMEFLPKLSWMVLLGMMLWFVFVLVGQLIFAVFLALIGLIVASSFNTDLKYKNLLNFSLYALTLPMIIDLAVDISMVPVPQFLFFMVYTAIAIVYLVYAVKAYKESSQQPEDEEMLI